MCTVKSSALKAIGLGFNFNCTSGGLDADAKGRIHRYDKKCEDVPTTFGSGRRQEY